jgi:anti-sigma factor RsiW
MSGQGHLGDLLSAFLDGELDTPERSSASAHLDVCTYCSDELAAVAEARRLMRSLPPVEPPFGFYLRLLGLRRRRRAVAAVAAAAVAATALVSLRPPPQPRVVAPPVSRLVEDHAATASVAGDPVSELVPVGVPVSLSR